MYIQIISFSIFLRIGIACQQFHTKGKIREAEADCAQRGKLSSTTQTLNFSYNVHCKTRDILHAQFL